MDRSTGCERSRAAWSYSTTSHAALADRLQTDEPLDVLVIGYSGWDRAIVGLLNGADVQIRRMHIVAESFEIGLKSGIASRPS